MNEEYSKWLNELQVGDQVIVINRNGSHVDRVTKVTKTQIHTRKEKYRKSDGHRIGDDAWAINYLEKPTPERLAEIKKRIIVYKLQHQVKWDDCSSETLEKVFDLVKQHL